MEALLKTLANSKKLPIELIIQCHNIKIPIDWRSLSLNTPIKDVVNNSSLQWDWAVIENRVDFRMIHYNHIKDNNISFVFNVYQLTKREKLCDIASQLDLPWHPEAIATFPLTEDGVCEKHLLELIEKYGILWGIEKITNIFSLETILNKPYLEWDITSVTNKLLILLDNEDYQKYMYFISNLDKKLIDFERLTPTTPWYIINKTLVLPWDFYNKPFEFQNNTDENKYEENFYKNEELFSIIKNLYKNNIPINWKDITKTIEFFYIESNELFPWDEDSLIERTDVPMWFIIEYPHIKWDKPKITSDRLWNVIYTYRNWDWDEKTMINFNPEDIPPVMILRYFKYKWNWTELSRKYDYHEISQNDDLPWDWDIIISRDDIPYVLFDKYPEKNWIIDNIITNNEEREKLESLEELKNLFSVRIAVLIFRRLHPQL